MVGDDGKLVQDEIVRRQVGDEQAVWGFLKGIERLFVGIARLPGFGLIC